MTPRIIWGHAALFTLRQMHWRTAATLCRAIISLAETGEGRLEWVAPYYRLRVGPYDVALAIDRRQQTMTVFYIWRADR